MARQGDSSKASTGFIVEKWSCGGGPQQDSWSTQPLTDLGVFMRWVEKSQEGHWAGKSSMAL
jgi:hypothetical protein